MAEDTYRALLWTIGRVESAADLDHAGRARVLDHMRACGWKPAAKPGRKPVKPRAAHAAQVAKVEALCAAMKLPLAYALGIASRQTRRDVQSLAWLKWDELRAVIAALMVHQRTHHPETVERRTVVWGSIE